MPKRSCVSTTCQDDTKACTRYHEQKLNQETVNGIKVFAFALIPKPENRAFAGLLGHPALNINAAPSTLNIT